ncbi:MAG: FAD-dependent oxidoreductase [Patescibacteria group bacterium]
MQPKQKTIAIVGGGFGGLNAAILLRKYLRQEKAHVLLINKSSYHLYYPNLYEIASSEEEFVSIKALKKSIALPFTDVLSRHNIQFIEAEVTKIHQKENYVVFREEKVDYDYLVLATGAIPDFFNIPGAEQNALTFKSVNDALRVRSNLEALVQQAATTTAKRPVRIIIAGGGFTGVELAGELTNLKKIVAWKYSFPEEKIEIEIIEGANQLMPGMGKEVYLPIAERLKEIGVRISFNSMITEVSEKSITLKNGEVQNFDMIIWAAGIKGADIPFDAKTETDHKNRCMTSTDLTLKDFSNVYLIGDNACVLDSNKMPMPQTATQAIDQAEFVAHNIAASVNGYPTFEYVTKPSPYIIPVKGKWALLHLANGVNIKGFFAWFVKQFANLRYFMRLLPPWKAIWLAWFDVEIYTRND